MSIIDDIARLGGWEGYDVSSVRERWVGTQRQVWIELKPQAERTLRCSSCGGRAEREHERRRRRVRDLPIFDAHTQLSVQINGGRCRRAG